MPICYPGVQQCPAPGGHSPRVCWLDESALAGPEWLGGGRARCKMELWAGSSLLFSGTEEWGLPRIAGQSQISVHPTHQRARCVLGADGAPQHLVSARVGQHGEPCSLSRGALEEAASPLLWVTATSQGAWARRGPAPSPESAGRSRLSQGEVVFQLASPGRSSRQAAANVKSLLSNSSDNN